MGISYLGCRRLNEGACDAASQENLVHSAKILEGKKRKRSESVAKLSIQMIAGLRPALSQPGILLSALCP